LIELAVQVDVENITDKSDIMPNRCPGGLFHGKTAGPPTLGRDATRDY
jgi:hypothetical protein